jgi:hypothetical protein
MATTQARNRAPLASLAEILQLCLLCEPTLDGLKAYGYFEVVPQNGAIGLLKP